MHSAYALGWSESEVRDQEVEINAEIPGGGYSAAGHGVAKSFDTPLQSIHDLILTFSRPEGDGKNVEIVVEKVVELAVTRPRKAVGMGKDQLGQRGTCAHGVHCTDITPVAPGESGRGQVEERAGRAPDSAANSSV